METSKGFRIDKKDRVNFRISIERLFDLREDFRSTVNRCLCSEKALDGVCHPQICFFELYSLLYPLGGYYPRTKRGEQLYLRSTMDSIFAEAKKKIKKEKK